MSMRTRIAPSPTGAPHLGTAYVGLINRVFADAHGGAFVVRIEDTDQARSSKASETAILAALCWLGLRWDEGPDVGGPHGPYRQSERLEIYHRHARELIDKGAAFRCFCTPERLAKVRQAQISAKETARYDGHCLALSKDEIDSRQAAGEASVVRLKVPDEGMSSFEDQLRGEIQVPWSQVDMQVLMKSDGFPTYHMAACVDDHLMEISHLIRGEEWMSSVPKQQLLVRAFGWQMPTLVHLPLIRNPDGSKLSKRRNPTSIDYYRRIGILPEALLNYLGTLGWSMSGDQDIFSLDEMRSAFDITRVKTSAPVFDLVKLKNFNGRYVRALDQDDFVARYAEWLSESDAPKRIAALVQERTEAFEDIASQVDYLIGKRATLAPEDFENPRLETARQIEILALVGWSLERIERWQRDQIHACCKKICDALEMKFRDFLSPLFLAVSGRQVSLPLFDSIAVLGRDLTLMRIREAMESLGGLSKKREKSLRKVFETIDARTDNE